MASSDDSKKPAVGSSTDKPKKRINKPLIEKRRRERINECLNQLQTMITQLDKDKSKRTRAAKLEKADILEMTVEFIKNGQKNAKNENCDSNTEKDDNTKLYMAGYKKCVEEIGTFFKKSDNVSDDIKTSILGHVSKTLNIDTHSVTASKSSEEKCIQNHQSNQLNIKPKLLPASNAQQSATNIFPPSSSGVVIQQQPIRQTVPPSGNQVAVVCNREIPTYVLVPTATLCQSVPLSLGSQAGQNGTLPFALVNTTTGNSENYVNSISNDVNPSCSQPMNSNQIVLLPPNQTIPQPPNCFMGNFPNPVTLGEVSPHLNLMNQSLMSNNVHQPQPPGVNENDVWRPW